MPGLGAHGIAFPSLPHWNFSHAVANNNHVGIDVNSLNSIESAPATYFSDQEGKNISLELMSGNPMHLWIDYDETEKLLNVTLAPTSNPKTKPASLVNKHINLSQIFLESMYVGFSAATGVVAIAVVLITIIGATFIWRRKKYEEIREDWESEYGPHRFIYKNLYKATKGFSDKELLGAGGFGKHGKAEAQELGAAPGILSGEKVNSSWSMIICPTEALTTFMLEVACGKRPVELQGLTEEVILVDWVFECWRKGAIFDASDPRLQGLGLLCSQSMPAARPSMRQVMQFLDGDADLPELPSDSACFGTCTGNEACQI
uniref:Legume lectin domain-containing protein n=1 Tax=Fagus sylvatica TaxID=28930 RepID=A0A2N9IFI8_FAGSY